MMPRVTFCMHVMHVSRQSMSQSMSQSIGESSDVIDLSSERGEHVLLLSAVVI